MTIKQLKELISEFPDDYSIIGQCLTPEGLWLTLPVDIGKALGDNTMVIIQLKPLKE